jgi:hypothetical protein
MGWYISLELRFGFCCEVVLRSGLLCDFSSIPPYIYY